MMADAKRQLQMQQMMQEQELAAAEENLPEPELTEE
jgi:hypothetical protein